LHNALADDSGFLRRFRAEAQVAASLHHRNIMTVHDWGEDGVPFMVLELLSGGSLRSMLDAGNRLSPAQAAHVGGQVGQHQAIGQHEAGFGARVGRGEAWQSAFTGAFGQTPDAFYASFEDFRAAYMR